MPDPRDKQITDWLKSRSDDTNPVDVDAAWSRFSAQHKLETAVTPLRRRALPNVWKVAAVVVAILGGSTLWRVASRSATPAPMREVFALNGQRTSVTLDDGTRISLNGGSRVRYTVSKGDRDAYLDGEAFFDVKHDPARAFRVHAKRGVIRDIGTRFSVRAYSTQPNVEVAVVEGIVALSADSSAAGVELKAGDLGVVPIVGAPTVAHLASLDRYVGFANGSLVLDGVALRDAASQLEHWYGLGVKVEDTALATRPVVARFRGETITQALDAITLALGARYERQGDTYVIRTRAK